jgi:DNA-binding NarL/FixJ family response regulator
LVATERAYRQARPTRILIVSPRDGQAGVRRALENGVHGYLGGTATAYRGLRVLHDSTAPATR